MKKNISVMMMLALVVSVFTSCKKDKEAPIITINQPTKILFAKGDTVWMDIVVADNDELHLVEWDITKLPNEKVYENKRHQHASRIHIKDTYYIIPENVNIPASYRLSVEAEDESGNKATKTHNFTVE
jgi:hypothetical protein